MLASMSNVSSWPRACQNAWPLGIDETYLGAGRGW
jgi:hypothetical protein